MRALDFQRYRGAHLSPFVPLLQNTGPFRHRATRPMFPPLCPAPARNRSASACWRCWPSCWPTRSSWPPSSPWSRPAARLIFFSWIPRPFTALLNGSAGGGGRLLGLKGTSAELEAIPSPEELRMLVEQSRQRGKLDADDARLLQGVFEFSEKTAREVMTPRTEMVALPADLTLEEAADHAAVAGRSRYPVYGEP